MVRRTAAILAMLGFALGCLLGALAGCSLQTALGRALLAMGGFFIVGLGVGWAGERLLREHFAALTAEDEAAGEAAKPAEQVGGESSAE